MDITSPPRRPPYGYTVVGCMCQPLRPALLSHSHGSVHVRMLSVSESAYHHHWTCVIDSSSVTGNSQAGADQLCDMDIFNVRQD